MQLPGAGALPGANGSAAGSGLAGSVPIGATAPVSEGFSQIIQGPLSAQEMQTCQAGPPAATGGSSPSTWGHMVQQMVLEVNNKQQNASALVNDVLKGGPTPVHQAMIATEEAGLSFEFLAEVRNKVIDAYNQVMQMQV
jgi:flagellar hook-basal body complex protein FliE